MFLNTIVKTNDGSPTLYSQTFNQTYHSTHGAIAESEHVFIKNGIEWYLKHTDNQKISIFEMGFGTGLNCYLTEKYTLKNNISVEYLSIEKFPIETVLINEIANVLEDCKLFESIHQTPWEEWIASHSNFKYKKTLGDLLDFNFENTIDIIFYDAFSPNSQPELWSVELFHKLYNSLNPKGILTTYCAKGQVKRNLKQAGFDVLSLPGPIGKREMTLCVKK